MVGNVVVNQSGIGILLRRISFSERQNTFVLSWGGDSAGHNSFGNGPIDRCG